jgi:hypothetical protein
VLSIVVHRQPVQEGQLGPRRRLRVSVALAGIDAWLESEKVYPYSACFLFVVVMVSTRAFPRAADMSKFLSMKHVTINLKKEND